MRMRDVLVGTLVITGVLLNSGSAEESDEVKLSGTELEIRALELIEAGRLKSVWKMNGQGKRDSKSEDADFSIVNNALVWRFHGTANQINMVEYLLSTEDKAYETLLVVEPRQMQRVQRVAHAAQKLRESGGKLRIQLAFASEGKTHVRELADLLTQADAANLPKFFERARVHEMGWEGYNLETQMDRFPANGTSATLVITARRK